MTPQEVIKKFMARLNANDYSYSAANGKKMLNEAVQASSKFADVQAVIDAMKADQIAAEKAAVEEILGSTYAGKTLSQISSSVLDVAPTDEVLKKSNIFLGSGYSYSSYGMTVRKIINERKASIFLEEYCGIRLPTNYWIDSSNQATYWNMDGKADTGNVDTGAITGSDANITLKAGDVVNGTTLTNAYLSTLAAKHGSSATLSGDTLVIGTGVEKTDRSVVPESGDMYLFTASGSAKNINTGSNGWVVNATSGNDTITTGGRDSVNTGAGNDSIKVGADEATVTTGNGSDTVELAANVNSVTVTDLNSSDTITISGTFEVGNAKIENSMLVVTDKTGTRKIRFNDLANAAQAKIGAQTISQWLANAGYNVNSLSSGDAANTDTATVVEIPADGRIAVDPNYKPTPLDIANADSVDQTQTISSATNINLDDVTISSGTVKSGSSTVGTVSTVTPAVTNFTVRGLTVHVGDGTAASYNQLTAGQKTMVAALFKWWADKCLELNEDSYDFGFTSDSAKVTDITLSFENLGGNTLARVEYGYSTYNNVTKITGLKLKISTAYYSNFSADDKDGESSATGALLDRTLAHEFTHAVMVANNVNAANFPQFIMEGMAELTHGIDDERGNLIFELGYDASRLTNALDVNNTSTGQSDCYAGGYMFLRYLAKQAALQSMDLSATDDAITLTEGNDTCNNTVAGVELLALGGNDSVINYGTKVIIDAGNGDDSVTNYTANVTIIGGDGSDSLHNDYGANVSISGGTGNDSIFNNGVSVTVDGGAGNDTVTNYGATVTISGGAGSDFIFSDALKVTIDGGAGNDNISLDGNAKNNLIEYADGDGDDTVTGFNATATLKIGDGTTDTYATTKSGNDIIVTVGEGSVKLAGAATLSTVNIAGTFVNPFLITLTENADGYSNSLDGATVQALAGNDTITNYGNNVSIDLGAGNDTLGNAGSNVTLDAGDGDDHIENWDGNNVLIIGGNGNDLLLNNYDTTNGNNVTIDGGAGDDSIQNMHDSVTVSAGDDNDLIANYASTFSVNGGSGNDSITNSNGSNVTIDAGDGNDTIANSNGFNVSISGGSGNDSIINVNGSSNVTIDAGAGDDSIVNGSASVSIDTGDGNDSILNLGSNVTISGGKGNDSIDNSGNNVSISTGTDNDQIVNGSSNVTIDAGAGDDKIGLGSNASLNLIQYADGDGFDTVYGFKVTSTLKIGDGTGTYSTTKSGSDIIVTVGEGSVLLVGAASLSTVNISGEEESSSTDDWTLTDGVASYKNLFTLGGLKDGVTVDDIKANVTIEGTTVTLNENILGTATVIISDGYTLALASTVEQSETISAAWEIDGTTATFTGEHVTEGYVLDEGKIVHVDATDAETFTLTGVKQNLTVDDFTDITIEGTTVTLNENILGDEVTISDGYDLALADGVPKSATVPAAWDIDGTTATFTGEHVTEGYTIDDEGKIVHVDATDAETFTLTGVKQNLTVDDFTDITIEGTTVTLNENILGDEVTISDGYDLALADGVPKSATVPAAWDIDGTTATFTGEHVKAGYTIDDGKIVHVDATNAETFTLTGVKKNLTDDVLAENVEIDGTTVTLNENVLGTDEVTISDGYELALASTVEQSETISAAWDIDGTTATFTGEHVKAGYTIDDGKIVHVDATNAETFTLTGVKKNLTDDVLAENVEIDGTTVTLNENILGTATVIISGGYTLALAETVPQTETADANWDINDAGDTKTAIYSSGGTTAGYSLVDNKISYINATNGTFTLTGLSKTFVEDNATVDGNKIILSADALGKATVKLTTTDDFALALDENCPTVTNVEKSWTLDGTKATLHGAGKSDGYKLTNTKTVTYTAAVVGKTLLTVSGVVEGLSEDDLNENFTVSGKTLTVTPDVVGENFSVDAGYKVVFATGDYDGSTFTGTTGKDTVEVNGSGLVFDLGKGNDTVTSSGDGGNTYLFASTGGKDVIKGFSSADTIKITDGSNVTASVTGKDVLIKVGSATMTLKNAATGTHVTVLDADDNALVDETFYADRVIDGDSVSLTAAFNSTSIAATSELPKVDGSAVSRRFSITGGDEDNELIGGTGANFINGNGGTNELTGGKGNDTFVAGNGNDTITDYGVGTDKISLSADIESFAVEGNDVILSFGTEKSATIVDGVGKKINFLRNGKTSTELFESGGKTNTAKTSITLASATDNYTASTAMITIDGGLTGNVSIVGNAKANKIFGSSGDDVLNGKSGNDTLTGNDGADIFVYETGKDVITDYDSETDKISLTAEATSESVKSNGDVYLKFGSNSLTIKKVDDTSDGRTIVFTNEDGDDTTKTYFSEKIVGSDGVTLMSNFAGTFEATEDLPKVDASATTKKVTLTGGDENDELTGGKGNNLIDGGSGDDILIGGKGADTFVYSSGDDTIADYESKDRISLTSAMTDFTVDGDNVIIGFGDSSLTIADAANSAVTFVETTNGKVTTNVNVFASDGIFNKTKTAVTLNAAAESYTATSAVISIDGGLVTDAIEIVGNTKANKIFAGDAGATLNGGTGNDSLWGGNGDDTFVYSAGKDVIYDFGDGDELQISGDFTAAVNGDDVIFKVGSTAKAVTLKDITTDVVVNGETYAITNGSFVKKN